MLLLLTSKVMTGCGVDAAVAVASCAGAAAVQATVGVFPSGEGEDLISLK